MRTYRLLLISLCLFFLIGITACGDIDHSDSTSVEADTFLSITYKVEDSSAPYGWTIQYYLYDTSSKELTLAAEIPFNADYAVGAVSPFSGEVYYASRSGDETSDDDLLAYNPKTEERRVIDTGKWSYNDICVIDKDHLLVTAVKDRSIQPAIIELSTGMYTDLMPQPLSYMTEPYVPIHYNYQFGTFVNYYTNVIDPSWEDFFAYHAEEAEAENYISLMSCDPTVQDNKVYTFPLTIRYVVDLAIQTSQTDVLLRIIDISGETEARYYTLDFAPNEPVLTQIDNPFPEDMILSSAVAANGENTFYCKGLYRNKGETESGVFYWDANDNTVEPILLNKGTAGVVKFHLIEK